MTKTEVSAPQEAWGELGPAMRELSLASAKSLQARWIAKLAKLQAAQAD